MSEQPSGPSPVLLFETLNAYQRSEALRAAIELDLFTAVAEGKSTPSELGARCGAAERGVRILADYLTVHGFLTKEAGRYGLTPDSAAFLDRRSPAYMGGTVDFLLSETHLQAFRQLTAAVRKGGTAATEEGTVEAEHPVWVKFARAMMPMMALPAEQIAGLVECDPGRELKVLDLAAGHGLFGLAFARKCPKAGVTALDWPSVLEVARENAEKAGVGDRYRLLPGSAFEVPFPEGNDLVLLTNFLHHFDVPTCEKLLRKVRASLADGGRVVTLEFVPNEDRISPPMPAGFALTMLAGTPGGDAYTFAELEAMLRNAGFSRSELHVLPPGAQSVIVSAP